MPRTVFNVRSWGARTLAWAVLASVPAVALLTAGPGVLPALTAESYGAGGPRGAAWAETRSFRARGGSQVALPPQGASSSEATAGTSADGWRNTIGLKPVSTLIVNTPISPE